MGNVISSREPAKIPDLSPQPPTTPAVVPVESPTTTSTLPVTSALEESSEWSRIRRFWDFDQVSMERYAVGIGTKMTFFVTFVIGGMASFKEIENRVAIYTRGHNFGSPRNEFVRKTDFKILQFVKNGLKYSFKCTFITAAILLANTHAIMYKDRFQYWCPPLVTASVTGFFAFPLGVYGSVQAASLGVAGGSIVSSTIFLYSLYRNASSGEDAYNLFRAGIEEELQGVLDHETEVKRFMKQENISTRYMAERKMKQRAEEKLISGGLEFISDEDPVKKD